MKRFADVQFFGSDRIVGFVVWGLAQNGEPKRSLPTLTARFWRTSVSTHPRRRSSSLPTSVAFHHPSLATEFSNSAGFRDRPSGWRDRSRSLWPTTAIPRSCGGSTELFTTWPFLGSRRMTAMLRVEGLAIKRNRVRRVDAQDRDYDAGPEAAPEQAVPGHKIFPYLLCHRAAEPSVACGPHLHSDRAELSLGRQLRQSGASPASATSAGACASSLMRSSGARIAFPVVAVLARWWRSPELRSFGARPSSAAPSLGPEPLRLLDFSQMSVRHSHDRQYVGRRHWCQP
jgi:hypothetical protein